MLETQMERVERILKRMQGVKPNMVWGHRRGFYYILSFILSLMLSMLGMMSAGLPGVAQSLGVAVPESSLPIANPFAASGKIGNIVYAPVTLDGRKLFQITAEEGIGERTPSSISPLQMRVTMYETKLNWAIAAGFDPQTLEVSFEIQEGQTVLFVRDGDRLGKKDILTLTELDARLYGIGVTDLATHVSQTIAQALIRGQFERQPEYLRLQGAIAVAILLGTLGTAGVLRRIQQRLKREWNAIATQAASETRHSSDQEGEIQSDVLTQVDRQLTWERQRDVNLLKRRVMQMTQLAIALGSLATVVGLFPQTRWLQSRLLTQPLLLLILLLTSVLIKLAHVAVDRCSNSWIEMQAIAPNTSKRLSVRVSTFSHALKGMITFTVFALGLLLILYQLQVPIAPVLAGAGIAGFAISFASQNLIRDVINGSLILLEDHYAIGDVIDTGAASGVVEYMNLRITQIRGSGGRLSTIPNGSISTVHNLTKDWSRLDFTIEIACDSDVTQALQVVKEVAEKLHQDPEWGDRILDPVNVLGVNQITHQGIEISLWMQTQPGQQWRVGREFRHRLKIALDQAEIEVGIPQRSVYFHGDSEK